MTKTFLPARVFISRYCPYAQRVSLALTECGMIDSIDPKKYSADFELVDIDLRNKPEWYLQIHPQGKVPAMEITLPSQEKKVLIESALVAEFVIKAWGPAQSKSLVVQLDPLQQYTMRRFVDLFEENFTPMFYKCLKEKDQSKQPELQREMNEKLGVLDAFLKEQNRTYSILNEFSWADLMTAPFVMRLPVLEHFRGYKVPSNLTHFHRWLQALQSNSLMQVTTVPKEDLIKFYKALAE